MLTRFPSRLRRAALVLLLTGTTAVAALAQSKPATAPAAPSTAPAVAPAKMAGNWLGTLSVGAVELRLAVKVAEKDGKLGATLNSLDQGGGEIPTDGVTVEGSRFRFGVKLIGGAYEGTIDSAAATIDGKWSQGGQSFPLVLKRVAEIPTLRRPQEPKRPFPYKDEEVSFESAPGIRLGGTLTLPKDKSGPVAAVVLISGSGPQDRDEFLMGHRPFLVLADHLTRAGVAVLRFDDRGVGKSTGNFLVTTFDDSATDALAAVKYLKGRPEIDKAKIGLIGHSEGGLVAPVAVGRSPGDVAFVVLLAGVGVPVEQILTAQLRDILAAERIAPDLIEKMAASQRESLRVVRETADDEQLKAKLRELHARSMAALTAEQKKALGVGDDGAADQQLAMVTSPWFRGLLKYDPAAALAKVKCPVLAVCGEKDIQVRAKENLSAIKAGLAAGGNTDVEVVELPGLNHLFQPSETGKISEYGKIEQTFAPAALEVVGKWVAARAR